MAISIINSEFWAKKNRDANDLNIINLIFVMSKYPKVKFTISKKKELETFLAFLNESKHLDNKREINWAFYRPHPKLKILKQKHLDFLEKKSIVRKYINVYYKRNLPKIKEGTLKAKKDWQDKERDFFNLVSEIFKNYPWPKGKYIAYPTIWGMYPRFLKNKTFQFPYCRKKKNFIPVVIAHEMLHFMFYEHIRRTYSQYKDPEHSFLVWHISEIFNSLVQDSPSWLAVFKKKTMPYPEHERIIAALQKRYADPVTLKADGLIREITPLAGKLIK